MVSLLIVPLSPGTVWNEECGDDGFTRFPLTLDSFHPNQLCTIIKKVKKLIIEKENKEDMCTLFFKYGKLKQISDKCLLFCAEQDQKQKQKNYQPLDQDGSYFFYNDFFVFVQKSVLK